MPTRFGNIDALEYPQSEIAWFMLSIRAVTAETMNATLAEFKVKEEARRVQSAVIVADAKRESDIADAEATKRAPILAAFRKNLATGTMTNCGRVLGFNGPLVEVQVPAGVRLSNGATRVFVERRLIEPNDSDAMSCSWD